MTKYLLRLAGVIVLLVMAAAVVVWNIYGGGERMANLSQTPQRSIADLETVAELAMPPCNIAVSASGRVFFTFHPEAKPDINLVELVEGKPVAYPNLAFNSDHHPLSFQSVQSVRIDRRNWLWVLDHGNHGTGSPRLLAFNLATGDLVHHYDFTAEQAPLGSQLNDFQISPDGNWIYIADASVFRKAPAVVVYNIANKSARRVLRGHPSVVADRNVIAPRGEPLVVLGVFAVRPNIDSIALDAAGEWLYYSPTTDPYLYRIHTQWLIDERVNEQQRAASVEVFARKSPSNGIGIDADGTIYITDPEQSAILKLTQNRQLITVFKHKKINWPDGISFGPDQWIYLTTSGLQDVIMKSRSHIIDSGPYYISRFKAL